MNPDLDKLSDGELNAAFAAEVAGSPLAACTDATVLWPFIESQFMLRSHFGKCDGMMPWIVEVQPKPDSPILFVGHGQTFARAAVLALLRAKRATNPPKLSG